MASAVAATLLLALIAALIRPPVIEGSMVDQLSGTTAELAVVQQIATATGDRSTAVMIVTPADVSIAAVFADLGALRHRLADLDSSITLRSIDVVRDQLFVYGLDRQDLIIELLGALRGAPEARAMINNDGTRFLLVVSSPKSFRLQVVDVLDEHAWTTVYAEHTMLASAQLEIAVAAGLKKDLRLLLPLIVAVTLVALFAAFGYWRALSLPLFASVASTVVTFALFSAMVVTINLVTLLALPIVLIVGLANSCHFLAKSLSAFESPDNVDAAVRETMRRVGPPFFFSTLTTSIALASLGFNELPPIANLGLLSAGALLIVFLLVLLAAPLSLRWYLRGASHSWRESRESRLFAAFSRLMAAWRMQISSLLLLAMIAGAASVPLLNVKSEPRAFFPDNAPFSSALSVFEAEFYFFSPLQALVSVQGDDPLLALRSAGVLRDLLVDQPGIKHVALEPAANPNNAYVVSALFTNESDLPPVFEHIDSADFGPGVDVVYTNASLVYGDIDRQAMESLLRSVAWSAALIFGAVLIVFRSVRALLSAMLANAVPLMLVCGVVWLIGNPLNLVTIFVFLVALGVIVDDSIHILFWRAAGDPVSGSSIEFSVLLSTVMLCLGLFLCQLSDFPTTRLFAGYCALALIGAVISNLTVLPLLLGASRASSALS
ncbi:MAG: MMPL family transporter [Gammaproteobacteria bacterium]|nr:MMPL family transporter [Gammaproteobacteria bacterium]